MEMLERIKGMAFGLAAGDALGVPVEFKDREFCRANPVSSMQGFGSHHQPAGTWSDDASMTFCTMEAMLEEDFDPELLGRYFLRWMQEGYWTPHGIVFDRGLATSAALERFARAVPATLSGGADEMSNGNGSLMRIAPLAWHPQKEEEVAFFQIVQEASSVTHRHPRSVLACHFFLKFMQELMEEKEMDNALKIVQHQWPSLVKGLWPEAASELGSFSRILSPDFASLPENAIQSSGYVMHSLEASIWCLLNTDSYAAAVLKAVNLGEDTDTTGAVCGALAGAFYGFSAIPSDWVQALARQQDIEKLVIRFYQKFQGNEGN